MTVVIERIVVALDAVSENHAAIGAAARLAARRKIRLHGVFIEDDELIRLARLPFARQVTLGGGVESLTLQQAERQLRAFAERARRDLAASARRHTIEWSFEIVRGAAAEAAAALGDDLLVAGIRTRPVGSHFRAETRWWFVGEAGPAIFLLAHRDPHPDAMAAVLLNDRGPAAERLLAAAVRLAEESSQQLAVFCSPSLAEGAGFRAWLDERVAGHAVAVHLEYTPSRPAALLRRIAALGCGLVALEAGAPEAQPDRLRELVAKTACDVLLVR
jgi:hypothetical protein